MTDTGTLRRALSALLPLRIVVAEFRFTTDTDLPFFHQPAVGGMLRTVGGDLLKGEKRVWFDALDSGRGRFYRGDAYRIALYASAGGDRVLRELLRRLQGLPEAAGRSKGKRLGPNLKLVSVSDYFTAAEFAGTDSAFLYDLEGLHKEVEFWRRAEGIQLQFVSPARLLLPKTQRNGVKGEARFVRDRGQFGPDLLGQRLQDTVHSLAKDAGIPCQRTDDAGIVVREDDISWIDARYRDSCGDHKPMGGITGVLSISTKSRSALELLVLGQYLGIGQRRLFGWGRYRLVDLAGQGTTPPRVPHRSVMDRAADPHNLDRAWRHISSGGRYRTRGGGETLQQDVDSLLHDIGEKLRHRTYEPPPLQGVVLEREGRTPRPLAVPPFGDRVTQRAVVEILQSDLETLHSPDSYGYRRGISRRNAKERIQALRRQGYTWYFEADIEDFFDSVLHDRLETRLGCLLGDDPVVQLLMAWVRAPVIYRELRQERPSGLPQGAPVSPMLANLLLDDFDADMAALDMKLVRFADDFVVLCRSRQRAEAAARRAEKSLAELGLTVNPDKTRIAKLDEGLRFLGYVFLGDLAVESPKHAGSDQAIPPASWLARLAQREPSVLESEDFTGDQAERRKSGDSSRVREPAHRAVEIDGHSNTNSPGFIFVTEEHSRVSTRNGRIRISCPSGTVHEQPWSSLSAVVLFGPQRITHPCLRNAMENEVPLHFASQSGSYQGLLASAGQGSEGHGLWLAQAKTATQAEQALAVARPLVKARIRNQAEVLRQRGKTVTAMADYAESVRRSLSAASKASTRSELNGAEGRAARDYFAGLSLQVPAELEFAKRQRRPPPDPFNALLSLGYSVLYQHVDTVIRASGLLPWIGFYHQSRGRHAALASDLMEPFRHTVERRALTLVTRGELTQSDFFWEGQSCRLTREALKKYLSSLVIEWSKEVTSASSGHSGNLHSHLAFGCRQIIGRLRGDSSEFEPFILR